MKKLKVKGLKSALFVCVSVCFSVLVEFVIFGKETFESKDWGEERRGLKSAAAELADNRDCCSARSSDHDH